MIVAAYIAVIALAFASGYLVSLYALAVYIDPDDVRTLFPGLSKRRETFLERLAGDPRAFVQVATIYKSFVLILTTTCYLFAVDRLTSSSAMDPRYFYLFGLVIMWILHILVIEYLPRSSSRRAINQRMIRYLWLISIFYVVFLPMVRLYRYGLRQAKQDEHVTEEEKEEIVERAIETLADQAGIGETIVEEDEKEMIGQIFLLDQTQVREVMSPRIDIVGIQESASFAQIQELVRNDGHSRYPVYGVSIDKIVGVLYVKDVFSNMPGQGEEFIISSYLRKPYFVPESKVIGELLREFRARKLHIAIVADEYGGVAGLITLEDIIEEIVGEIQDEHDSEEAEVSLLADGHILVDASLRVDKLQDHLGTDYDQDDYDTVGGLIYDLVGSVPKQGEIVKWNSVEFEIVSIDGQRIKSVKILKK
ncbi:MAG: hypothetical protein DRP45_00335 [Candidatus Zixiibacteriota bacterium]|nr:MAG: hypothetical protein DRP45_00335 [candidate division Zixibacteria bacterium]